MLKKGEEKGINIVMLKRSMTAPANAGLNMDDKG
jgi:hypothetical protein